jgi:16S rRNA pseudouridine516 synthase
MMAAVGNHVAGLHRSSIGAYTMPSDLPEGEWRWLYADDLKQLGTSIQDKT